MKREEKSKKLVKILRSAKLRITEPRMSVLKVLSTHRTPLRVKDIEQKLKSGKHVNLVTLYRNVEALRLSGVVRRVDLGEDAAYYEIEDPNHDNHQVICATCGRRNQFKDCMFVQIKPRILNHTKTFSEIMSHSSTYFGICKKCAKKS